jgi:hypothetical protein
MSTFLLDSMDNFTAHRQKFLTPHTKNLDGIMDHNGKRTSKLWLALWLAL